MKTGPDARQPLQNRVMPDGKIVADNWRGNLMGNRGGRIHDPATKKLLKRQWVSKRWIHCVLQFKGRKRSIMGNSYTELFFLDEVTALTAGHRPCFECQRDKANNFARIWEQTYGAIMGSRADGMDQALHLERTDTKSVHIAKSETGNLPDGTVIRNGQTMYARKSQNWLEWRGDGYRKMDLASGHFELLTPTAIIRLLQNGYEPCWHESAFDGSA